VFQPRSRITCRGRVVSRLVMTRELVTWHVIAVDARGCERTTR
jgi:hypothetical protein